MAAAAAAAMAVSDPLQCLHSHALSVSHLLTMFEERLFFSGWCLTFCLVRGETAMHEYQTECVSVASASVWLHNLLT